MNFSCNKYLSYKWFNDLICKSNLAESSKIRGCLIFQPYGLEIWNKIKNKLNYLLKKTGHENYYFPLLISITDLNKEYNHIKGFSKECAIVTHRRLNIKNKKILLDRNSKLKNELIIRPTSEAIIWNSLKKWINSYRDLPRLLNQWSNIIRWEMRPRFLLRNSEFILQEGHTVHSSKQEALSHSIKILNLYKYFIEKILSIPVIKGKKTPKEKFAGANTTYCLESVLLDGKALQIATSHFLGQNFSKSFDVKYFNKNGIYERPWGTSYGISTRLIGALVFTHSDKYGLILPPKIAPIQVVIISIIKKIEDNKILEKLVKKILVCLKKKKIRFFYDNRKRYNPGWKFNEYDIKGVPLRITIGKNEIQKGLIEIFRRDNRKRKHIKIRNIKNKITYFLKNIQKNIFLKALFLKNKFTKTIDDYKKFKQIFNSNGGLIYSHWDGRKESENKIKEDTSASIICIPSKSKTKSNFGHCIYSNNLSKQRVIFAKCY
ncbi:proline--tRNA ligase [Candidatus Karelsulcia muelleri]|nr:proline--tRNA ligase [Candidatus Karelsulcia muelleri]WDI79531.1 proline--tRNA ligase [Candidatus Karelsulcia muelleri]WDR78988.1 proline--tRNA ligase [Candidatus Karelsulcia muelleri]